METDRHSAWVDRTALRMLGGVSAGRVGALCGAIAFVLYLITAAPGVYWQDSGVHQYRVFNEILENPLGLALSHPLHYYICRFALALWPGEPALMMNLVSSIAGAVGVGLLGGLLFTLTRMLTPALLGAGVLMLAHTYWQMSAVTETYTIAAALMIAEWCILAAYCRRRDPNWLILLLAVNGLHVADHLLGLLTLVAYLGLFAVDLAKGRAKLIHFIAAGMLWAVAAMPYWSLVLAHYTNTHDLGGTISSALFGGSAATRGYADEVLNTSLSLRLIGLAAAFWIYNFPSAAIPVAIYGMRHARHGRLTTFWRVVAAHTIIVFLFVMRYSIRDQITFYVPVCAITALWCGHGAARLIRWASGRDGRWWATPLLWSCVILPPLVYAGFPAIARQRDWLKSQMRELPHRDAYSYILTPWKCGDTSAQQFARDALQHAGAGGWFLANHAVGPMTALVVQTEGGPSGVRVFDYRESLTVHEPPLTDDDVRSQLRAGGEIIVAPYEELGRIWGEKFAVEKTESFWRLRLK